MKCRFDADGICQGKYEGFGCITEKCDLYAQRCEYLANPYCLKYKRFFCVGNEDCNSLERYLTCLRSKGIK